MTHIFIFFVVSAAIFYHLLCFFDHSEKYFSSFDVFALTSLVGAARRSAAAAKKPDEHEDDETQSKHTFSSKLSNFDEWRNTLTARRSKVIDIIFFQCFVALYIKYLL